jgi:two-component system nitrate/nitrite response regulator NarL
MALGNAGTKYNQPRVPPTPRLLVVAEDALSRAGLRAVAEESGLDVVGERSAVAVGAEDGDETVDVVVWDLGPDGASADRLRTLVPGVPVLALLWTEEQAGEVLAAGARGLLLRDRVDEKLAPAVSALVAGLVVVDDALVATVLRPRASTGTSLVESLTPREMEVLQLVAEGLTNRGIGERLGISEHTAKFHVNAILGKLGARSRSEAVAQAARLGLFLL